MTTIKSESSALPAVREETKDRAFALYCEHASMSKISRALGVSTATLSKWRADGDWLAKREDSDRGIIEDAFAGRKVQITHIVSATTDQISRGIEELARRPEPPTLTELERLSVILANLDKIHRLDLNKATDNVNINAKLQMTAEQVREVIAADPFMVMPTATPPAGQAGSGGSSGSGGSGE